MTIETTDQCQHPTVSVDVQQSMTATAEVIDFHPQVSASAARGFRATVAILSCLAALATAPEGYMTVTECAVVQPIYRSQLESNFIEFAGRYVITADGKIFWVKEDGQ